MKNFTKLLAVILVFIIALSTAACSVSPQWSYKVEGTEEELPIGVYIYAMYNAYSKAQQYAQESDAYNAETNLYNGETSFLNIEITDEDGKKAVANQWILDETDKTVRTLLAINQEYDRLGATMDEAAAKDNYKTLWDEGDSYMAMYGYQPTPYKDIFEPYGISYESYEYFMMTSSKQQVIFDIMYGEGGEKAVSDEEFTKYFEENYTSYANFSQNLYTSEQQTGESGGTLSTNKPMSEDEIKEQKANFEKYVNNINSGKSLDDVVKSYKEDYKLESEVGTLKVEFTDEISIGDELKEDLNSLEAGKATYKIIGKEDSQTIYFLYKEAISNKTKEYIEDASHKSSVLANMKGEEFQAYIDEISKNLKITKSKYVSKYSPDMFEEKA